MFDKLTSFHIGLFYGNFLLLQLKKVSLSENHALPGKKIMKMGLTVANSVYQTHTNSVYSIYRRVILAIYSLTVKSLAHEAAGQVR